MSRRHPASGTSKGRRREKPVSVRKLSPETADARDEGPRLIPLTPAKEPGLGRIEHYLLLADKALGHTGTRTAERPGATDWRSDLPVEAAAAPAVAGGFTRPLPRKASWPKPAISRPPRLAAPKPPKSPSFPSPPKLLLPKPSPRRKRSSE